MIDVERARKCHRDEVIQLGFHTMDDFVEIRKRARHTARMARQTRKY